MATKRNIARNGAMGKSFYQSTKSKRARINAGKTTDPQKPSPSGRATVCIGIEGKTTIKKPHVTKNRKAGHTRSTQDPQRPKTRKVACRAGLQSIWHARTTKTTKTTWACGSSHACGYLGGYSLYFYIILYIYKSESESECE